MGPWGLLDRQDRGYRRHFGTPNPAFTGVAGRQIWGFLILGGQMWLWVHWGYKSPPAPKPAGIYRPHAISGAGARRVSLSGGR